MSITEWVERYGSRPSRLLAVGGSEDNSRDMRTVLLEFNCELSEAHDVSAATAMLDRQAYDLVLVDATQPGISGNLNSVAQVAARCGTAPVVVLTGCGDNALPEAVAQSGFVSVVRKPLDFTPTFIKRMFQVFNLRGAPGETLSHA